MNEVVKLAINRSHLRKVIVIALHTFTQLTRMKVFYFLACFATIILASNFIDLPQHEMPESAGVNVLIQIKSWSIGTMYMYSVILAVIATALIIPKDIEDRTLYTILAKPVNRLDYLCGKLLGVLMLMVISLLAMNLLMGLVLYFRANLLMTQQEQLAISWGKSAEYITAMRATIKSNGLTWSLQYAVVAVFLRAAILVSLTLLLSTFASSTLFTSIIAFLLFFIGHFQADARNYFLQGGQAGENWFSRLFAQLVTFIVPDFQIFNVIDAVIQGQLIQILLFGKLIFVSMYYIIIYLFFAWYIFSDKEF